MVDLLTISQTSLHNKQVMQRRQIFDRVVFIVKMIGKRGTSCRGTGSSEAVSTLCDEKVDHGTFLKTVLLAKYDNQACPWEWDSHGKCPMGWDCTHCISHGTYGTVAM